MGYVTDRGWQSVVDPRRGILGAETPCRDACLTLDVLHVDLDGRDAICDGKRDGFDGGGEAGRNDSVVEAGGRRVADAPVGLDAEADGDRRSRAGRSLVPLTHAAGEALELQVHAFVELREGDAALGLEARLRWTWHR